MNINEPNINPVEETDIPPYDDYLEEDVWNELEYEMIKQGVLVE